jgi:hypothetical protein
VSFDAYLQFFHGGAASGVSRHLIEESFAPRIAEKHSNLLRVRYGPCDECAVFLKPLGDSDELIHFLTIERPCGDERLWQDVLSMLRLGNGVLYFPGGRPMMADIATAEHLPTAMLAALGEPVVVDGPVNILELIRAG